MRPNPHSRPTPETIHQLPQNKPSRLAKELEEVYKVPYNEGMRLLLAHGACKWFAVRRDLIRYKSILKIQIRELHQGLEGLRGAIKEANRQGNRALARALRGEEPAISVRLRALEEVRQTLRALCHSDRWAMPDHDTRGRRWLKREEEILGGEV